MKYKSGDKVILKDDDRIYTIYQIYDEKYVSLGLYNYPDVEQDYKTHISKIKGI